jgi:hypothetical protein
MLTLRYKQGIFVLFWMSFLFSIPFFLTLLGISRFDIYGSLILPSIFLILAFITFLFGVSEPGKINEFKEKRALIKWRYTVDEWRFIMKKQKKQQQGDWKIIIIFFSVISLIVSAILGFSTKNIVLSGVILAGGIVFSLGLSFINYMGVISEFNTNTPSETIIGDGEFFYNGYYFKDNSKFSFLRRKIQDAKLAIVEHKKYLIITTREQRFNRFSGFVMSKHTFHILAPEKEYEKLHELLPKIISKD